MENRIIQYPSPFNGIKKTSTSSFLVEADENELDPFSFGDILNVFKKKDSGTKSSSSTSKSSSSLSSEKGSGIGSGILTGILGLAGVAGALAPILPQIGIGSKSRIAESNAIATANAQIYNAKTQSELAIEREKADSDQKLYLIIGVSVFFIVMVAGVLFKKR